MDSRVNSAVDSHWELWKAREEASKTEMAVSPRLPRTVGMG